MGRVQTPTLAMIVERDREIREFIPEKYLEVIATFDGKDLETGPRIYRGTWFREEKVGNKEELSKRKRLAADGEEAAAIVARTKAGLARIESVSDKTSKRPPPLLYDLTELQRRANRLFWTERPEYAGHRPVTL